MKLTERCWACGNEASLTVNSDTFARIIEWKWSPKETQPFVQDAFPDFSAAEREFLLNPICMKCQDDIFGGDDEDE